MPTDSGPSRRAVLLGASRPGDESRPGTGGVRVRERPVLTDGVLSDRFGLDAPQLADGGAAIGSPRGLVVALHGFGGSADDAFNLGFADAVETSRMALVSVDGGDTYWHARRDGSDTGAMVREELVPMALSAAGLSPTSPVTFLGWSMGGFGALLLASDLGRSRVSGVVAASAALWLKGSQTPARAYDGRADFDRHSIFNRLPASRASRSASTAAPRTPSSRRTARWPGSCQGWRPTSRTAATTTTSGAATSRRRWPGPPRALSAGRPSDRRVRPRAKSWRSPRSNVEGGKVTRGRSPLLRRVDVEALDEPPVEGHDALALGLARSRRRR